MNADRRGNASTPDIPRTIEGRYWKLLIWLSLFLVESGFGPFGFGPTPSPLALTHASDFRSGVTPAATGYAAVGTRPRSFGARGAAAFVTLSRAGPPARLIPLPCVDDVCDLRRGARCVQRDRSA